MNPFFVLFCLSIAAAGPGMPNPFPRKTEDSWIQQRRQMVQHQIQARGVKDPEVIRAMHSVKRHLFVPENARHLAYSDGPLPIGHRQTISQPFIVAYMTEVLNLQKSDRVLEIGTGSGYQAAVLAEIAAEVYSIEIIEELARSAEALLKELNYTNIKVTAGDGYQGWAEYAPFDAIIVTAAPPKVPEALVEQLKIGGRMIVPVGTVFQELLLIEKTESGIITQNLIPVRFVPMVK
jgi:protein-L-isoaspartate(D-aspartate) O-methyltransferase